MKERKRINHKCTLAAFSGILLVGSWLVYHSMTCAIHYPSIKMHLSQDSNTASRFAFAIKSGADIARERVPVLLDTFLVGVENYIVIGEADLNITDDLHMIDVISNLYQGLKDEDGSELVFSNNRVAAHETANERLGIVQSIPNENSPGWKSDAHKNIPAFRILFEKFPDTDWYMMIDDDSYVFMDNLLDFVADFNSSLPYYFGAANTFEHCDGVESWQYSTAFAHGGSGILISRAALLRLENLWDFCITRYHGLTFSIYNLDCWAGDVRMGLCLRNAGVLLTNSKAFHTTPPNDLAVFSQPCSKPITFHHLLPSQIKKLNFLERNLKLTNSRVTMADLLRDWLNPSPKINSNRVGDEYAIHSSEILDECKERCERDPSCLTYSFIKASKTCSLKYKVNALQEEPGTISGIIPNNFLCNTPRKIQLAKLMDLGL
jgi:hypothetical protein